MISRLKLELHCHTRTYSDKAVEKRKAAWRGQAGTKPRQGGDERANAGQTDPGKASGFASAARGQQEDVRECGQRTAGGHPEGQEENIGLASAARGQQQDNPGGQEEDIRRPAWTPNTTPNSLVGKKCCRGGGWPQLLPLPRKVANSTAAAENRKTRGDEEDNNGNKEEEGSQHEHTKRTKEGQAVTKQRQRTTGQHEGSTPRGEQEEKRKRGQEKGKMTTGPTRDRLAAAANEHLKKDNGKAREEHEEDRTEKVCDKR